MVRVARDAGRVGRLLDEPDDAARLVHVHHPEAGGLRPGHLDAADRHVGARVDVLCQHDAVVHLVDVVAGQDDDETHPVALDDVDVLGDGIRGAQIPLSFVDPLGGGQHIEHLVALGLEEAPAELQVADQAVGLVLGRHADASNPGVDRVGQREVDDPALAAEEHRRLRPPLRQLLQTAAPPSGEDESHRLAGQRARTPRCCTHSFLPRLRSPPVRGAASTVPVPKCPICPPSADDICLPFGRQQDRQSPAWTMAGLRPAAGRMPALPGGHPQAYFQSKSRIPAFDRE